jgi:3-methyladenine DNA glycosylase AlkD
MNSENNKINSTIDRVRANLFEHREKDLEKVDFFNSIIPGCINPLVIKTPILTKTSRELWSEYKKDLDSILNICNILWKETTYYEEKKITIFLLERLVKKHPDILLKKIQEFSTDLYTWDLVDQFGMRLCSELLKNNFLLFKTFKQWAQSSNFWIRRLSLVSLVRLRNTQLSDDQWYDIESLLVKLWEDEEYYVHKAMSWCLRELSKSNEDKVILFLAKKLSLKEDIKHVNKTFVKECSKKLPPSEQLKLLGLL